MNLRIKDLAGPATALLVATTLTAGLWTWSRAAVPPSASHALDVISDWPDYSRDLAGALIDEYHAPDQMELSKLTWIDRPPWKRMIVFRDAADPERPDVLLRTVAYRVPIQKWRALGAFGHGVEYDSVNEQLSARTSSEETNYLALNLADEVVRGRLSAQEASTLYDKTMTLLFSGKSSSYTSRLRFKPD